MLCGLSIALPLSRSDPPHSPPLTSIPTRGHSTGDPVGATSIRNRALTATTAHSIASSCHCVDTPPALSLPPNSH